MIANIKMQAGFECSSMYVGKNDNFILVDNLQELNEIQNLPVANKEEFKSIETIGVWKIKQLKQQL